MAYTFRVARKNQIKERFGSFHIPSHWEHCPSVAPGTANGKDRRLTHERD
jgi:hypothetical protein